jgi:hypothetical protein
MQSIGFKEWALVCAALGSGRQRVIIRKGGLAEGRDGFAFRHQEFFLLPTFFHEQLERVRESNAVENVAQLCKSRSEQVEKLPHTTEIEIRYFARVKEARIMTDWEEVRALEPLHILKEEVVRERFKYDDTPGVHVAFVEVFRINPVWRFPDSKSYGGCRSWVELPDPPISLKLHPIL